MLKHDIQLADPIFVALLKGASLAEWTKRHGETAERRCRAVEVHRTTFDILICYLLQGMSDEMQQQCLDWYAEHRAMRTAFIKIHGHAPDRYDNR